MWKFHSWHCENGSNNILGSDFNEKIYPSTRASTVCYIMYLVASWNIIGGVIETVNAFQNTVLAPSNIVYATMPSYYLDWFWQHFPHIHIKDSKQVWHILQDLNRIKGTKTSVWNFCLELNKVLDDFGLRNVPCEKYLYVLYHKDKYTIVMVSTDELLCFYCYYSNLHRILVHMKNYFPYTYLEGPVIKFLNLHISIPNMESDFTIINISTKLLLMYGYQTKMIPLYPVINPP